MEGGEQPTILLFGDSHSHAVHLAVKNRLSNGRPVPLDVFRQLKKKNGRRVGNISFDAFLQRATQLGRRDIVLSAMGGGLHATFSTSQHPQPFDFFMPDHPAVPCDGIEIVPYQALRAYFSKRISKGVGRKLEALRRATDARLLHLIPPPPKRNRKHIAQYQKMLFTQQRIDALEVSEPELRLKSWLLHARVLRKFCRTRGIGVLMPPPETMRDGFLRREFYAGDTAHANWRYGEIVLRTVETQLLEDPAMSDVPAKPKSQAGIDLRNK